MYESKQSGVIGLRWVNDVSNALLAKLGWQVGFGSNKLWAQLVMQKNHKVGFCLPPKMTGSQFESRNQFFQKKEIVGKAACHQFSQTLPRVLYYFYW